MSRIVRWDPVREMVSMRNQMDRLMSDVFSAPATWQNDEYAGYTRLALDVTENDENYTVHASVPGINAEDLEISFIENTLTIKGETKDERVDENEKWHLRERRFGSFMRSISLPTSVKADAIDAHFENGVLTLTLPKAEEIKPRRIAIKPNGQKMAEAVPA
ncbi:MAG: Hsp20/alpha crystallin family protein [Chloroflexi bacterium]|nr:MAG: Hsp20/alpha crystallin family protein [Chloroflexota bacterium]